MIPKREFHSNSQTTTSEQEVFKSPWQNNGKSRTRLVLTHNGDKATARIVSQNLFDRLFNKETTSIEKNFTHISSDRFHLETEELHNLLQQRTSLEDLLSKIEKDFTEVVIEDQAIPSSLPNEEIEGHGKKIAELRGELEALMKKIQKQENHPNIRSYQLLNESIKIVKEAATSAFSHLNDLENNPDLSSDDLKKAVNDIKDHQILWNQNISTIKQTLVEGISLKDEISKITQQLQSFSEEIQSHWRQSVTQWENQMEAELTSSSQVQDLRNDILQANASLTQRCKKELKKEIDAAMEDLEENFEFLNHDFYNADLKKQAHKEFRKLTLDIRKNAWNTCKTLETNTNDLTKIAECHQLVKKEKAIDDALIENLTIPAKEEGFFEHLYSTFVTKVTSMGNPFKAILPESFFSQQHFLLKNREHFDAASHFYVTKGLQELSKTIITLLEAYPTYEEQLERLCNEYTQLSTGSELMKSDLDTFINKLVSFAQTTLITDDFEQDIHKIATRLQAQKEAFLILLAGQRHYTSHFIHKTKKEHPLAFSSFSHSKIIQSAHDAASALHEEVNEDFDILNLENSWQQIRQSAHHTFETLNHVELLAKLQEKYQQIAEKREEALSQFTGKEVKKAEVALTRLKETLDSLEAIGEHETIDASSILSHKSMLQHADSYFDSIYSIENKKIELRETLNEEIDACLTTMESYEQLVEDIEKAYAIELSDIRTLLDNKKAEIQDLKIKGRLPDSYLNYLPSPALSNAFYYTRNVLSFNEISVNDLTPAELDLYIQNIKAEIASVKHTIEGTYLTKAHSALELFQEKTKEAKNHVSSLTSAAPLNYKGAPKISPGLSSSDVPKLQFYNSMIMDNLHEKLLVQQKKAITEQPNLKSIYTKLSADTDATQHLLEQSKRAENLSLIEQIEKLENQPDKQSIAKKALIETFTTSMAGQTKVLTSQIKFFKPYPKIYEETLKIVEKSKLPFFKQLKTLHKEIQAHGNSWKSIKKEGDETFSTADIDVKSISVSELKEYSELITTTIASENEYLKMLKESYITIDEISRNYQEKAFEARRLIGTLDQKDQLISKKEMEHALKQEEKSKEKSIASTSKDPSDDWLSLLPSFLTPSHAIRPSKAIQHLLDEYKKNIEQSISEIDVTMQRIKRQGEVSIPEQLASHPDPQTAKELKERFVANVEPIIEAARDKLLSYKDSGNLFVVYSRYVSPSSNLYRDIERAVDHKLAELKQFEKGHNDGILWSLLTLSPFTALSELDAGQMEDYSRKLAKLESTLEDDLNQKFHVESLASAQANFELAIKELAKKHSSQLRKNGLFTQAHDFDIKIREISQKEAKWENKITHADQLKGLIYDLKKSTNEIKLAIKKHDTLTSPQPYDEQINVLLNQKSALTKISPYNLFGNSEDVEQTLEQIDADIKKLKAKVIAKVDNNYDKHKDSLNQLKADIEEIYSTYRIQINCDSWINSAHEHLNPNSSSTTASQNTPFINRLGPNIRSGISNYNTANNVLNSKAAIINAIDNELYNFTHHNQFNTYDYPILSALTKKNVYDMSPEELAFVKPEKKHKAIIAASNKKIAEIFNYQLIVEPHKTYTQTIEKLEKSRNKLEKSGQISHAYELDEHIKIIKQKHERIANDVIKDETALRSLGAKLNEFSAILKMEETIILNHPELTPAEQLQLIPADSPYREQLKNHLVKSIREGVNEQKKSIKKSIKHMDTVVNVIGFPLKWKNTIETELETCRKQLMEKGLGLNVQTKSYGFTTTREMGLSELSIDNLAKVSQNLESVKTTTEEVLKKYHLKALHDQFKDYQAQIQIIEGLKSTWTSEMHTDCVEELDILLFEVQLSLKNFFSMSGNDYSTKIESLVTVLRDGIHHLYEKTEEIKKNKPKSSSYLLLGLEVGSKEYTKHVLRIKKQAQIKLKAQEKLITDYLKKVDTINEQIRQKFPGCSPISDTWRRLVEAEVKLKLKTIHDCTSSLPKMKNSNIEWTPFDKLDAEQLIAYEKLINQITAKDANDKNAPTSLIARLDNLFKLNDIDKYFTVFQKEAKIMENSIKQPGINKDKKAFLEAILESNKKIVFSAFKNLKNIHSSLLTTIYEAQASLICSNEGFGTIDLHPWATIYKYETNKKNDIPDIFPDKAYKKILKGEEDTGTYKFPFKTKDSNERVDAILEAKSFEKLIESWEEDLEFNKQKFEKQLRSLFKSNLEADSPQAKLFTEFLDHEIPKIRAKISALKDGVSIKSPLGIEKLYAPDEINTFDHLLAYKNHLNATMGEILDSMYKKLDSNTFCFSEEIQKTHETKEEGNEPEWQLEDDIGFDIRPPGLNQNPVFNAGPASPPADNVGTQPPAQNPAPDQNIGPNIHQAPKGKGVKGDNESATKPRTIDPASSSLFPEVQPQHQAHVDNLKIAVTGMQQALNNPDIKGLSISQLKDLAKQNKQDATFTKAFASFKAALEALEKLNLPEKAAQYKQELLDLVNVVPQEIAAIKTNLKNGINNILAWKEPVLSINQLILDHEIFIQAPYIHNELKNLNNKVNHFYKLSQAIDTRVDTQGGRTLYLSTPLNEKWLKEVNSWKQINTIQDISSTRKKLDSLIDICEKALTNDDQLRKERESLVNFGAKIEARIQKNIQLMLSVKNIKKNEPALDSNYIGLQKSISSKIYDAIPKLEVLTPDDVDRVKEAMKSVYEDSGLRECKLQARKFRSLFDEVNHKIVDLPKANNHLGARELRLSLEKAIKRIKEHHSISVSPVKFVDTLQKINEEFSLKLTGLSEAKELKEQLKEIAESEAEYPMLVQAIIHNLQQTAVKIGKENQQLSHQLQGHQHINDSTKNLLLQELIKYNSYGDGTQFKSLKNLSKGDILTAEMKISQQLESFNKDIHLLKNAFKILEKLNITHEKKKFDQLLIKLKSMQPYPYFYIDTLQHAFLHLNNCTLNFETHLSQALKKNQNAGHLISELEGLNGMFESALNSFETCYKELDKARPMPLYAQLQEAQRKPGILTAESERIILEGTKALMLQKIDAAIQQVRDYSNLWFNQFPDLPEWTAKIKKTFKLKLQELENLKAISIVSDPTQFQHAINSITMMTQHALKSIEGELKLKENLEEYQSYVNCIARIDDRLIAKIEEKNQEFANKLKSKKIRVMQENALLLTTMENPIAAWDQFKANHLSLKTYLMEAQEKNYL